jgi:hypothetical protein
MSYLTAILHWELAVAFGQPTSSSLLIPGSFGTEAFVDVPQGYFARLLFGLSAAAAAVSTIQAQLFFPPFFLRLP